MSAAEIPTKPLIALIALGAFFHSTPGSPQSLRNSEKGVLEKGYLHKIVRNWFSNLQQICDNFAHHSSDVRNEIHAKLRHKFAQEHPRLENSEHQQRVSAASHAECTEIVRLSAIAIAISNVPLDD